MINSALLAREYAKIKQTYAKQGRNAVIVFSEIRMEAALSASANVFSFNTQKSQSGFNTEVRLDQNDVFSAFGIGIFVAKPSSSTDSGYRLFTYGNRSVFSNTNTGSSIDGLYANGKLNISKDQVQYIQDWQLSKHYKVPFTQDNQNFGFTASGATLPNSLDSVDWQNDGFFPLVPSISFTGKDNMNININVPVNLTAVETNSRIVMILRGFKAYNAATR
jgi:hypothetical protein